MEKKDLYLEKQLYELFVKKKMDSLFPGEWESILKGAGYDFFDLRPYVSGDPMKKIHWKQTAKTGELCTKEKVAESYASVMLLYDISKSVSFGKKEEVQAIISASLAYSALKGNNSCGMIMFSDKVDSYIPPKTGNLHLRTIISHLQKADPKECEATSITRALQLLVEKVSRSLTFIISDFNAQEDYKNILGRINKMRHDIIPLIIVDPSELEIPSDGCIINLTDQETGGSFVLDAQKYREIYCNKMREEKKRIQKMLESCGCDAEIITTNDRFTQKINNLLKKRRKKIR